MTRSLSHFFKDVLERHNAVVEEKEDGTLETLLPQTLSSLLNQPEYLRLRFSYDESKPEMVYASYDSEFFSSVADLFGGRGRFARLTLKPNLPNAERLAKVVPEKIHFANATFRHDKTEMKNISYLLLHYKYSCLSDEKVEGIQSLLVNEMTLSTLSIEPDLAELSHPFQELQGIERQEAKRIFFAAHSACVLKTKDLSGDFIKSLERRLNRDVQRVDEYYETLQTEIKRTIQRKAVSEAQGEEPEEGITKAGEIDKLNHRLKAVSTEREWKIQDLILKHALNIQIEPVSALRIDTPSILFWINIRRRLSSRAFPVTYNPIIKQIDPMPCESCFYPVKPYFLCDEKLHIICRNCLKTCVLCQKKFCSACDPHRCSNTQ